MVRLEIFSSSVGIGLSTAEIALRGNAKGEAGWWVTEHWDPDGHTESFALDINEKQVIDWDTQEGVWWIKRTIQTDGSIHITRLKFKEPYPEEKPVKDDFLLTVDIRPPWLYGKAPDPRETSKEAWRDVLGMLSTPGLKQLIIKWPRNLVHEGLDPKSDLAYQYYGRNLVEGLIPTEIRWPSNDLIITTYVMPKGNKFMLSEGSLVQIETYADTTETTYIDMNPDYHPPGDPSTPAGPPPIGVPPNPPTPPPPVLPGPSWDPNYVDPVSGYHWEFFPPGCDPSDPACDWIWTPPGGVPPPLPPRPPPPPPPPPPPCPPGTVCIPEQPRPVTRKYKKLPKCPCYGCVPKK